MLTNVTLMAAVTVIFPLLAPIQAAHGLSTTDLGLMTAAAFGAALFAQLLLARLVDAGHVRLMLVSSTVLVAVGMAWLAVAGTLLEFVAARVVEGLGYALFAPAARSLVAAHDRERVGRNLGRLSAAELGGLVVGPLLGALLYGVGGTSLAFGAVAVAVVLLTIPMALIDVGPLRSADATHRATSGSGRSGVARMLARPPVRRAALLYLALYFPTGVYDVLWSRYLTDLGASTTFVGVSFAIYGIPYVLVAPLGGRLVDRIGAVPVAVGGIILAIPFVVAYGLVSIPLVVAVLAIGEAVANSLGVPAAQAAMVEASGPREVATGQGLAGAVGIGAAGAASLLAAPIYGRWGAEVVFIVTASMMIVTGAVAMLSGRLARPREADPSS